TSCHRGWGETVAISARKNFLVRLLVVGEAIIRGVPSQFLAWESRRLDGEQCRFRDARTDFEWSPQRLFVAQTIIRPILPMIAGRDLGHWLILDLLAFAENG